MASNYIKIYTGSLFIVQQIIERLKGLGISSIIKDETESGRLAGFASSIYGNQDLYVRVNEANEAIPIVNDIVSSLST